MTAYRGVLTNLSIANPASIEPQAWGADMRLTASVTINSGGEKIFAEEVQAALVSSATRRIRRRSSAPRQ